jgi:hypothetical protein
LAALEHRVGRPRAGLRTKTRDALVLRGRGSVILQSPMSCASTLRIVALGLLIAVPCFGKPPPHAPAKSKASKPAQPAPAHAEEPSPESLPEPPGDTQVKAAGTKEPAKEAKAEKGTSVQETIENDKGVKTYKFSAVEVEGRLKSPQIVYFLRRVRAEFEAGDLGHRSFMPELSDTRRSPALR